MDWHRCRVGGSSPSWPMGPSGAWCNAPAATGTRCPRTLVGCRRNSGLPGCKSSHSERPGCRNVCQLAWGGCNAGRHPFYMCGQLVHATRGQPLRKMPLTCSRSNGPRCKEPGTNPYEPRQCISTPAATAAEVGTRSTGVRHPRTRFHLCMCRGCWRCKAFGSCRSPDQAGTAGNGFRSSVPDSTSAQSPSRTVRCGSSSNASRHTHTCSGPGSVVSLCQTHRYTSRPQATAA